MPFKSKAQKGWMWKHKPELAKKWTKKYGSKVQRKSGSKRKK